MAKAGGGSAHNRPISAQLVSAALGVHLCCLSGAGLSVACCGICDRRRGSCLYTWSCVGLCCVWRALGNGDRRSALTPRVACCHRRTRNMTECHGLASGVPPHRLVSIKIPAGNNRHRQHPNRTSIVTVPPLATQLQHDRSCGRRHRPRKRWPQRWPKRVAEARTTGPAARSY